MTLSYVELTDRKSQIKTLFRSDTILSVSPSFPNSQKGATVTYLWERRVKYYQVSETYEQIAARLVQAGAQLGRT